MFRSYLKIAFRSFMKNRLVSFINIFGLGLSMSVGMMIMVRLQDQFSYDNFHPAGDRVYRVLSDFSKKTGEQWTMASTPFPLRDKLQTDFAGIEDAVNIYPQLNVRATAGGKEIYLNGAFTTSSFFHIFGFSLEQGNPATALNNPGSIVISKNTADKFFGAENPIGKVFTLEKGETFVVTGVLNKMPGKSHINYDAYASSSSIVNMEKNNSIPSKSSDWYAFNNAYTYVLLKKGVTTATLKNELKSISGELNSNMKEGHVAFEIQSINKITPGSDYLYNDTGSGGSWSKLYFEMGFAFIILLAACFNYTNLTIARALTRAKEVGVRKVTGAKRSQIFVQYIIESVLLSFLALSFAWVLLSFIIQYAPFNDDYEFIPSTFRYNTGLLFWSAGFALFTGLLAGSAPAWILSSFKPLRVLKNLVTARIMGKVSVQKTLIVFQYSLSLVIIIFLVAFYKQFSLMGEADPGFKRDNVLVLPLNGLDKDILAQKISSLSGVKSVSAMSSQFKKHFAGMSATVWLNNKQDAISLNYFYAEPMFIDDMELKILSGQNFDNTSADNTESSILINEQAARAFGFKHNNDAPGKSLWINDSTRLQITGVLKDFNYANAGSTIMPLAIRNKKNEYNYLYVAVHNADKEKLVNRIEQEWAKLAPAQLFTFSWLSEDLAKNNSQSATISLLGYLAFIAFSIASLGLLGLVVYSVEVKRKEISIRKIIGATERQLVSMLSKGFIKLLIIAGLISMPIGYVLGFLFLQNFTNRTHFGPLNVFACFLILFVMGLITIISQTYKSATVNPANDLRME